MKTLSSIILFTFIFVNLYSQNVVKQEINTNIKSATIYFTGAELCREHTVDLVKGNNQLIFKGISSNLNDKSIRISADTELSVLSISTKRNYLINQQELPAINKLKDSLKIIENKIAANNDEIDAYQSEKTMIMANKSIGGANTGVTLSELKQSADFFRNRILAINKAISKLNNSNKKFTKLKSKYHNELYELNSSSNYTENDIIVLLKTDNNSRATIKLEYLVNNAGWVPTYDIKTKDLSKPIDLIYKAKVFNNTNVAWTNVDLKLSISDPSLNINKPVLKPWYVGRYMADRTHSYMVSPPVGYVQNRIIADKELVETEELEFVSAGDTANINTKKFDELTVPDLNTEFHIKTKYNIPADDKPYVVEIEKYSLPAVFQHCAVTKMDKAVFIVAKITDWEDLNLVDADANIYFKGSYLGQSHINTRNVKDTLDLSLGRDEKVIVTRSKLKSYSSRQMIGNKVKETLSFQLIAKNNRKAPINIEILDQIPISKNSDVEIKILNISNAEYNDLTGETKWRYNLKPGESKKILLSFSIKYPKNQKIQIQQMKKRSVRKF